MTTARVIRGTKAKIFLYICAVFVITGLIVCFNNTLSQLDDVKKSNEICHQQEENLSTQLQVISDYKQRLEKSLKTEKAEHQQTKTNSENKVNAEKVKYERGASEANLKFSSLQQHFNLLQTQHDDFKEECSQTKEKQLNEINDLQAKLKEVQQQLKKIDSVKESLKTQYLELKVIKENLEEQLKGSNDLKAENESKVNHILKINHELQRELDALKEKCGNYETIHEPSQETERKNDVSTAKSGVQNVLKKSNNIENELPQMQEKNVLALPSGSDNKHSSTKSTTASGLKVSKGKLNGARPLLVPTVTPETINKSNLLAAASKPAEKQKVPEGFVPIPEKQPNEHQNEPQSEIVNNRYQNKIDKSAAKEEIDKENGAQEVFDVPVHGGGGAYDGLGFGDKNEAIKQAEKQNFNKQHIDAMGVGDRKVYDQDPGDYKEVPNDIPMEENPEDDDVDEYDDHVAKQDPAVRN